MCVGLCNPRENMLTKIFALYDDDKESIKTLYPLVLVCKIFHEPARDALWRFQRSFATLVKMFPEDVLVDRDGGPKGINKFAVTTSMKEQQILTHCKGDCSTIQRGRKLGGDVNGRPNSKTIIGMCKGLKLTYF